MKCPDCVNSYDGADGILRCRIEHAGLRCTERLSDMCAKFEREPGADSQEAELLRGLCPDQGRGD